MSKLEEPALVVDAEFQRAIPPLSSDERIGLERQLKAEGCRDALVAWKQTGILLDGHNRKEICEANGLGYRVDWIDLPDRETALLWQIRHQRGRRNLTDDQRAVQAHREGELLSLIAKRDRAKSGFAAVKSGDSGQFHRLSDTVSDKRSDERKSPKRDVRAEVAKEAKVPERKVRAVAQIAKAKPALVDEIAAGTKTIAQAKAEVKAESVKAPTPKPDGPPWAAWEAEVNEAVEEVRKAAHKLARVGGINKDNNKKSPYAHFITWVGSVGQVMSALVHVTDNMPGGPSDKAPGYMPAHMVKSRESLRAGKGAA